MTKPLEYESSAGPLNHPPMAWGSLATAIAAFALVLAANFTGRPVGPMPNWMRVLPYATLAICILGLILGIFAVSQKGFAKWLAITGIVINGLLLLIMLALFA